MIFTRKEDKTKWSGVRIPESLMKEVERFVSKSKLYTSKGEFVRDASRHLLSENRKSSVAKIKGA